MKVCNDYRLLIHQYIDGELDADAAMKVEAHISSCPACRRYCDELCMVGRAVKDVPLPKDLHASIMAAVSAEMAGAKVTSFPEAAQPVRKKRRPVRRFIGAVAAMLAIACVGAFGMENGLTSIFPVRADNAMESCDETVNELERSEQKYTATKTAPVMQSAPAPETAPEAETEGDTGTLPVRIEESMTGWFTDSNDHVQVVECGTPMTLDVPDDGEDVSAEAEIPELQSGDKQLDTDALTVLDDMLGEVADGYGFCLVAAGRGADLPSIFAEQAGELYSGCTLVITVRNDLEVFDQIQASMQEAGFELWEDTNGTYFAIEPLADEGLVIVQVTE